MKAKDLILIALICANVALGTVALTLYAAKTESQALAGMTTSRSGDYVMATASLSRSRDTVLVIDVTARRANLYASGTVAGAPPGGRWDLMSTANLAVDFHPPR